MQRISITYKLLENLFKHSLGDNYIIAIEPHPFMGRTIVAYFHGDDDDPILLTDEVENVS